MAVFTITTFSTFAGLLVAGHKLATDPNPVNWIKALADLASNGKALAAAYSPTPRATSSDATSAARGYNT